MEKRDFQTPIYLSIAVNHLCDVCSILGDDLNTINFVAGRLSKKYFQSKKKLIEGYYKMNEGI